MGIYRTSRNIEASFIQFIEGILVSGGWTNIAVEKGFARVYDLPLPVITVRTNTTDFEKLEIGSDDLVRSPQIMIDIFGSDDGNRMDLADFIVSYLKSGLIYYEYTIENGTIKTKTANGRIRILDISSDPLDFGTMKSSLDARDRFRHVITLTVSLGKGE